MRRSDWQDRWDAGRIPFHEPSVNALLKDHSEHLRGARRILVPLSGKSVDIIWLASLDDDVEVVAVELIDKAVRDFHADNGLSFDLSQEGPFRIYRSGQITTYQGDFFELKGRVEPFDVVYDRAALIALPVDLRERYVAHLSAMLRPAGRVLLVVLDFDRAEMGGPPFGISDREIEDLFASRYRIDLLHEEWANMADYRMFAERGMTRLRRALHLLTFHRT